MAEPLPEGAAAPDFSLPNSTGETVSLKQFQGRWVVLYFYPKDGTPGCTKEGCSFRDSLTELQGTGATVLGVSRDSLESHRAFAERHGFSFGLLSDADAEVSTAYGVYAERILYGRKSTGIARTTFLIDGDGRIRKVWRRVKPDGHAEEVLAALKAQKRQAESPRS